MEQYKAMFEAAAKALAEIDYALGIGADVCNDLEGTLFRIAELKGEAEALVEARGIPVGYLPAYELQRLASGHDAKLRSAKFGPSSLDGDVPVFLVPHACGTAIARVIDSDDFAAEVSWILNPLPAGTLLYEGPNAKVQAAGEGFISPVAPGTTGCAARILEK